MPFSFKFNIVGSFLKIFEPTQKYCGLSQKIK